MVEEIPLLNRINYCNVVYKKEEFGFIRIKKFKFHGKEYKLELLGAVPWNLGYCIQGAGMLGVYRMISKDNIMFGVIKVVQTNLDDIKISMIGKPKDNLYDLYEKMFENRRIYGHGILNVIHEIILHIEKNSSLDELIKNPINLYKKYWKETVNKLSKK